MRDQSTQQPRRPSPEPPSLRPCEQCGRPFLVHAWKVRKGFGRYCTMACFYASQRLLLTLTCPTCGKTFQRPPNRVARAATRGNRQFCTHACSVEFFSSTPRVRTAGELYALVDKAGPVPEQAPELGPCWLWLGPLNEAGYGRVLYARQERRHRAHRLSFYLTRGYWPADDCSHLCHRRDCINPDHLVDEPHAANMARAGGWRERLRRYRAGEG
jgi:hypothetical protein